MSPSLLPFIAVQTTTDEPLLDVAVAAWSWAPGLVVLTSEVAVVIDGSVRSSRASQCRRRPGAFGLGVGVLLRAHCRKVRRKNENIVGTSPSWRPFRNWAAAVPWCDL